MRVIAGSARGRQLKTRKGRETRPTADRIKESLFGILATRITGCRFLDVFAGNGGIGIEALSRGVDKCVFIEKNNHCVKIIKDNLMSAGFTEQSTVIASDAAVALSMLQKKTESFDVIFLDPPYHSPELAPALQIIARGLLTSDGLVIVEHHSRDTSWRDDAIWIAVREKKYGDTTLTFLVPAAAGGVADSPEEGGE
ncbi:MAG: 16S rRNA (guanine(966)-N(2))-methyltransferase RsmD [Bacillota bacterium]|nr:16S rRNA (guanine(966)-N(2))-methyltransferase RsmD [Bacillota bacterium]MDW7684463.1 16S rRNA (guanine(966)-N(2))-methyltransferase RsmD [Bacillota bacterium]